MSNPLKTPEQIELARCLDGIRRGDFRARACFDRDYAEELATVARRRLRQAGRPQDASRRSDVDPSAINRLVRRLYQALLGMACPSVIGRAIAASGGTYRPGGSRSTDSTIRL
jgi:hypothetical protein